MNPKKRFGDQHVYGNQELGEVAPPSSGAPPAHAHAVSDVTGLQAALDDKSDDGHGHSISDIAYLQSELDSKVGIGSVRYDFIDTTTGQGLYRVVSPVGVHDAGMLLVSQCDAYNYQTQVYFSGSSIFTRQGTTGSWGVWKEVSWSDHTHSGTYEPVISAGTTGQYWRGDKSWQTLNTAAVPESGNLYFTADRVLATALTGYSSGANTPLAATDSILAAFGKIQGQLDGKTGLTYIEADDLDSAPAGLAIALSPIGLHDDGAVITSRHDAYGYQAQLWMTGSDLQMRQRVNGTWGAWVTFSTVGHTHLWADITDKPSTFTPSAHTHTFASLTSKPTTLAGYGITDAALSTHNHDGSYSPLGHNHNSTYSLLGHSHTSVYFSDTRSTNIEPFSVPGMSVHLKSNSTDGLSDGGTYHGVVNITQWLDLSGGNAHQLALTDNGNLWHRMGTTAANMGAWKKLIDSSNIGSQSVANADTLDGYHSTGFVLSQGGLLASGARGSGADLRFRDISNGLTYALYVEGGNLKLIQV